MTYIGLFTVVASKMVLQVATLVEPLVASVDLADEVHLVFLCLRIIYFLDFVMLLRDILKRCFTSLWLVDHYFRCITR